MNSCHHLLHRNRWHREIKKTAGRWLSQDQNFCEFIMTIQQSVSTILFIDYQAMPRAIPSSRCGTKISGLFGFPIITVSFLRLTLCFISVWPLVSCLLAGIPLLARSMPVTDISDCRFCVFRTFFSLLITLPVKWKRTFPQFYIG